MKDHLHHLHHLRHLHLHHLPHQTYHLEHQKELRTLYLQENLIEKIENVMHLSDLDSLNLSQNCIRVVEGLWDTAAGAGLAKLQNLHLKHSVVPADLQRPWTSMPLPLSHFL